MTAPRPEETLATTIAGLLEGARHIAVGMASPLPATGALLARERSGGRMRVSILGNPKASRWTNSGSELFDLAGTGGIDGFFLSGGQIDGQGNINLVGVGDYPQTTVRWSGSFGSAYLYFVVPRVILFRWEHSRRTLVEAVDFISAPGVSEPGVHRTGGPIALLTNLCLFDFDKVRGRFTLRSVHPGHTLDEVRDNTGFAFDEPDTVPVTPEPDAATLAVIRGPVAARVAEIYPLFAREVFGRDTPKAAVPPDADTADFDKDTV
jgi:glutaconate CoA-transferase subunit B